MRVLVLGSTGLLGCTLVPHLSDAGHEVYSAARRGDVDERYDFADKEHAFLALNKLQPDAIINLAALTNVDECENNPQLAYLANVRVVENLAQWIHAQKGLCHIVQISTDQVYDGAGAHKEEDITISNCYGFSKYAGEMAAMSASATILRTNFFGPSLSSERPSLTDWLMKAMTEGQDITVFEDVYFSPLAIQTLVEMIELAVRKRQPGIFNLGSKDGISKADFAFEFASVMDLPLDQVTRGSVGTAKLDAHRPENMRMDSSKFELAFTIQLPNLKSEIASMRDAYGK